jgi:hypothetical protein
MRGTISTAAKRKRPGRPTFTLRLRAEPHVDPVRALRAALKVLFRRFGLRCVSAREDIAK